MALVLTGKSELVFEYPVQFDYGKYSGFNLAEFSRETSNLHGAYVFQVRKPSKRRTTKQNRVQWWYFNELAKETGHTPNMIKGMAQYKFLMREHVNTETGEITPYILDTSELDTMEHNYFMEDVRAWAKDFFGIDLPLPDPNRFDTDQDTLWQKE